MFDFLAGLAAVFLAVPALAGAVFFFGAVVGMAWGGIVSQDLRSWSITLAAKRRHVGSKELITSHEPQSGGTRR